VSLLVGAQAVTACSSPGSTPEEPDTTASDIREDQFVVLTQNAPRVLADDPPDLMRLPQMSELATDGLLLNLDSYAEDFGRDAWPASQLEQMRGDDEGRRGDGPLYAMGVNAFPLQALMASYGDPAESNDWVYQKPDATIVTPSNLEAGVSAGGGLAAATALLARERGGPRLAGQMLI